MLSEEALILVAVAGACVLLVLGVLELMWPTRPRSARRARVEPVRARALVAAAPPRPPQSILPRRLIDSPSASRPAGGFVFPPPADYVAPPPPREEVQPIRPLEPASPVRPIGSVVPAPPETTGVVAPPPVKPVTPPEPAPIVKAYIPPAPIEVEPEPIELSPAPSASEPPALAPEPPAHEPEPLVIELERRAVEPEPQPVEPEPRALDPEPRGLALEPLRIELEPQATEPEPRAFEPERRRLVAEPLRIELEPRAAEPEPGLPPIEPEPQLVDSASPVVEPETTPVPPPPEAVQPPRAPIAVVWAPSTPPLPPSTQIPPAEPVAPPQEVEPAPQPPAPPKRRRRSKISPHARQHRVLRPLQSASPGAAQPVVPVTPSPPPVESPKPALPAESTPAVETKLTRDSPLVERCFALYQEKRFDEVLTAAEPALAARESESSPGASRETAALWSVVGLAKQALGDDEGAHAALESSITAAPETERPTYRRHLATLALESAQVRLARAGSHDAADRMAVIRSAIAWTDRGLVVLPSDSALGDAREASHDALWQAYEQAAMALLQRQEFPAARQILREALDDPKLPAARAAGFRGLLAGTYGGQMGQLTAQAILGMQEGRESEAMATLQRAEELLATIPTDALPPSRREEVDQRLWWAYAELGSRRLDAGDYEEAFHPLVHALRFTSIGPERQAETRAAVVRTLEGIAAVRALSIRRLAEAGSRDEAIVAAGELNELVKRGLELGITEDELLAAFARVRRLCEELGMDARA